MILQDGRQLALWVVVLWGAGKWQDEWDTSVTMQRGCPKTACVTLWTCTERNTFHQEYRVGKACEQCDFRLGLEEGTRVHWMEMLPRLRGEDEQELKGTRWGVGEKQARKDDLGPTYNAKVTLGEFSSREWHDQISLSVLKAHLFLIFLNLTNKFMLLGELSRNMYIILQNL